MENINELIQTRIKKIQELKKKNINPYPIRFFPNTYSSNLIKKFDTFSKNQKIFKLAGRLNSKRVMGKASFAHLKDFKGQIQFYIVRDEIGTENYSLFKSLDLGDHIGIEGYLFQTQKGEVSLHLTHITLLAKCIRPLPIVKEKEGTLYDSFSDVEQRYRLRYLDLIVNDSVKQTFIIRSKIIAEMRRLLTEEGFLEVETPMMQPIAGGAAAKPFTTHHNTLNMKLFLRIAPELYLKRLIVGGMEKIFELNRNFRNEGMSTKHNPEFTMMEAYLAYGDMEAMLKLTEKLITQIAHNICQTLQVQYGKTKIDLTPPWKRKSYCEIIFEWTNIDFSKIQTFEEAKEKTKNLYLNLENCHTIWEIADEVFSDKVEKNLIQPIFITDFPKELSPLAKPKEDNPDYVERFEPYIAGREIGNAFSELNDPFEQKQRFEEQIKMHERGKEEVHMMDKDFIKALEYGMPPTGGLGIGIDRLVMLLTNSQSIRDTIFFPLMKPE